MSNVISLKRITHTTFKLLVNGEHLGNVRKSAGSRIYTATLYDTHITGVGQADLKARIGDLLESGKQHTEQLRTALDAAGLKCPHALRTIADELLENSDSDAFTQGVIAMLLNMLHAKDDGDIR